MSPLGYVTLATALVSAVVIGIYWLKKPELNVRWRLLLFVAIAALPTLAAGSSTLDGMERTTQVSFCGSCHVMEAHYQDAIDPESVSLASRHTRNDLFGNNSCYRCHADYGMMGYPLTKLNGLKHVWHYYFGEYGNMSLKEALPKLETYEPYPNENCRHCHAGQGKMWREVSDHREAKKDLAAGRVSCADVECHGAVHPDSLEARRAAGLEEPAEEAPSTPSQEKGDTE